MRADARYFARKPFPTGSIEVEACPLCGSDQRVMDFLGGKTNWALCENCDSAYKAILPSEDEIKHFYNEDYRKFAHDNKPYPFFINFRTHVFRIPRQLVLIYDELKNVKSSLDIGCALGWMPKTLEFMGIDAYGVELHNTDREWAKENLQLTLYETLEDLPRRDFDLITMSHVLEHIADPIGYIRMLVDEGYLAKGGGFLVEVPGAAAPSAWSSFHAVLFNAASLQRTMEEAGLNWVKGTAKMDEKSGMPELLWGVGSA